jgi:hypothetical protein
MIPDKNNSHVLLQGIQKNTQQFKMHATMEWLLGKVKGGTTDVIMSGVGFQVNSAILGCLWFSDEAHFHLAEFVNKQNTRY